MASLRAGMEQLGGVTSMGVDGVLSIRKGFPFREFVNQCWFIAKVTMVPVVLIAIPVGVIIALHVGALARHA